MQSASVDFSALPAELQSRLSGLPGFIRAKLSLSPTKGRGHGEIFGNACSLLRQGFSAPETEAVIRARFTGYYRNVPDQEIEEAIDNAGQNTGRSAPRWPHQNDELCRSLILPEYTLKTLSESSPVKNPSSLPTGEILDRFFADGDLLCVGNSDRHAFTEPRKSFRGREQKFPLLVPNPMSKPSGLTRDGRPSARCLDNSGPWRVQVIEFDTGSLDEQANLIRAIADCGVVLRMVVFSGGKSLHGWFDVAGWGDDNLLKLRRYAAALGADTATFTSCQFVRNPNAVRDNGKQQSVRLLA